MITADMILKCDEFKQAETIAALKGIAKVNNDSLEVVAKAYRNGNKSVVACVEKHVMYSALELARQMQNV